jgi:hypothetical protein
MWKIGFWGGAAILGVVTCTSCGPAGSQSFPQHDDPVLKGREIVECRVFAGPPPRKDSFMEFCVVDPDLIKALILTPIEKAERDPHPATHVILGSIKVIRRDGSSESYRLFSPWGHFRRGRDCFIGDLGGLREAIKEALTRTSAYGELNLGATPSGPKTMPWAKESK